MFDIFVKILFEEISPVCPYVNFHLFNSHTHTQAQTQTQTDRHIQTHTDTHRHTQTHTDTFNPLNWASAFKKADHGYE